MSAHASCYSCLGTSRQVGFGRGHGSPCSCCHCACGEPAEPNDDGEAVRCDECQADRESEPASYEGDLAFLSARGAR